MFMFFWSCVLWPRPNTNGTSCNCCELSLPRAQSSNKHCGNAHLGGVDPEDAASLCFCPLIMCGCVWVRESKPLDCWANQLQWNMDCVQHIECMSLLLSSRYLWRYATCVYVQCQIVLRMCNMFLAIVLFVCELKHAYKYTMGCLYLFSMCKVCLKCVVCSVSCGLSGVCVCQVCLMYAPMLGWLGTP